jgi:hypothetical protein
MMSGTPLQTWGFVTKKNYNGALWSALAVWADFTAAWPAEESRPGDAQNQLELCIIFAASRGVPLFGWIEQAVRGSEHRQAGHVGGAGFFE